MVFQGGCWVETKALACASSVYCDLSDLLVYVGIYVSKCVCACDDVIGCFSWLAGLYAMIVCVSMSGTEWIDEWSWPTDDWSSKHHHN